MMERVHREVGQFQVSDEIQGVIHEWDVEVEEVVIREEGDQEQKAYGGGGRLRLLGE